MNQNNDNNKGLPFVKCLEIKIKSEQIKGQIKYDVRVEDEQKFTIKPNALVIIENKLKLCLQKDKISEYLTIMIKKLNFVINLIKNTSNDLNAYNNIQLLLIYNDVICNRDELKNLVSEEQINMILKKIPFNERSNFSIEIIYISQTVNIFNLSKTFDEMKKMQKQINGMKNTIIEMQNKNNEIHNQNKEMQKELKEMRKILQSHGWLNEEKKP